MDLYDVPDGEYAAVDESTEIVRSLVAGAAPVKPPSAWLEDPKLERPTPLTIDKEGRVYGHIATWDQEHIGLSNGVRPPRSRSGYAFFRTGTLETAEGKDFAVGQLTLAGGHAPLRADAAAAAKHYDDTASAVADVACGEDMHGIWVAGALRPDVTDSQIRTLRASAPSGDWRVINGNLELVAVCQVNVPGFPIPRGLVASGQITALVAAGATAMYERRLEEMAEHSLNDLARRIAEIEDRLVSDEPAPAAEEPQLETVAASAKPRKRATYRAKRAETQPEPEPVVASIPVIDLDLEDKKAELRARLDRLKK